jgi:hypothetical protein
MCVEGSGSDLLWNTISVFPRGSNETPGKLWVEIWTQNTPKAIFSFSKIFIKSTYVANETASLRLIEYVIVQARLHWLSAEVRKQVLTTYE